MTERGVLRERLRKIEALMAGAATPGERDAAQAARERLMARLAEAQREGQAPEIKFKMADSWSLRLFVALCRRYKLKPYRQPRQHRTTVMVRVPRTFLDTVLWPEFKELNRALFEYLDEATERIIREEVYADAGEPDTIP